MRCLTLAKALQARGALCHFISRPHPGHLFDTIREQGFTLTALPSALKPPQAKMQDSITTELKLTPSEWLGCDWQTDAAQTGEILLTLQPDWLITDHYALALPWEAALKHHYKKLMVIDDLADRAHACDLLLDQNLGRQIGDYTNLVPVQCQVLTGSRYALLRPEFEILRAYSLKRRANSPQLKRLLITMGGVDQINASAQVLQALHRCSLPVDCRITVVLGLTAPWMQNVRELAALMPWPTEVLVNVNDMAQLMADSDLAIGAAGSTSWERCCLGVPTLMVVVADNQKPIAQAMEVAHAARLIGAVSDIATQLPLVFAEILKPESFSRMGLSASEVTDGQGVEKVLGAMGVINV